MLMLIALCKPNLYISHRKRRKKIRVMIIESKNGSSDSEDEGHAIPGPPPGSPKLYHTVEFIKKFAASTTVSSQEFQQTSTLATASSS